MVRGWHVFAPRAAYSDDTSVMLVVEPFFKGFIEPQGIADTSKSREVIVGLGPGGWRALKGKGRA